MSVRKQEERKPCEGCGRLMQRKRYQRRLEDLSAYRHRRFCGQACSSRRRRRLGWQERPLRSWG